MRDPRLEYLQGQGGKEDGEKSRDKSLSRTCHSGLRSPRVKPRN